MDNKVFALDTYLERLNYSGVVQPTEDRLEALHRAQVYRIPFENFDILLGRGISLEPAALCDKLVHRARGGYCFELNGLFLMALQTFGFDAHALLARVHLTGTPTGRGHQLALVTLHGREWIAETHPSAFFTFARVAALPTPNGRVSLFNCTLRTVTPGAEHVQKLEEGQAYLDALKTHFGIALDAPYEAIRPLPH